MYAPLSAHCVYQRDLCQESTTLRQTKLNEAGSAHSGKLRLRLQLHWELLGVPPQTSWPSSCTHHHHHSYSRRRRPRRSVFFIVFKYRSLTATLPINCRTLNEPRWHFPPSTQQLFEFWSYWLSRTIELHADCSTQRTHNESWVIDRQNVGKAWNPCLSQTMSVPLTADNVRHLFWAFIYSLFIYFWNVWSTFWILELDWEDLGEASAKVKEWRDLSLCYRLAVLSHLGASD